MVYVVGLPAPAFPAFGPQVEWKPQILAQHAHPVGSKILPVVDIPFWAFVGRITGYPASQCLKCLLWASSSLSTGSQARANRIGSPEYNQIWYWNVLNDWKLIYVDVAPHSIKKTVYYGQFAYSSTSNQYRLELDDTVAAQNVYISVIRFLQRKQVFDSLLQMELYNLNPARNKCPIPAEAPPLRGSGADASTASSSSKVYVVGLLGPAFPAFGPHVGCPVTDISPTWPTSPTPLVPKILPVVDIPFWAFVGRITGYPASQCLKCLPAPSSRSTRSQATGQIRETKERENRHKWIKPVIKETQIYLQHSHQLGLTDNWWLYKYV